MPKRYPRIVRRGFDPSGEIAYAVDLMPWEKVFAKCLKVKPFELWVPMLKRAIVEIEAVYIYVCRHVGSS